MLRWLAILPLVWLITACSSGKPQGQPKSPEKNTKPPLASDVSPQPSKSLTLLTYNIAMSAPRQAERTPVILELLKQSNADVIALQEASIEFIVALSEQPWFKDTYSLTKLKDTDSAVRGVIVCTKLPIEKWEYRVLPGPQQRAAVLIHTTYLGKKMFIATTHLESPLNASKIRAEQLKLLMQRLNEAEEAILLADLNFGDDAPHEAVFIIPAYVDAWRVLHPSSSGFTFDLDQNPEARTAAFIGETSRRLDRILVRSNRLKPKTAELIGMRTGNAVPPSDHFGVLAVYTLLQE